MLIGILQDHISIDVTRQATQFVHRQGEGGIISINGGVGISNFRVDTIVFAPVKLLPIGFLVGSIGIENRLA